MRRRAASLERRLLTRLSLALAGSLLLFAAVYLFVTNDAPSHAAEETGEAAERLAGALRPLPDGGFGFDAGRARAIAGDTRARFAAIEVRSGAVAAGSAPELVPQLQERVLGEREAVKTLEQPDGLRVVAYQRVDADDHLWRIALSRPMSGANIAVIGLQHEILEEMLPGVVPALLLAIAVTWLTIRRNLRPLRRASDEARAVSVEKPGQRMSTRGMAAEILPVIDAVNRALARLEGAISQQKRFMADAAHELRTPLAVLRARTEALPEGEARAGLMRDIDRMSRSVAQLLLAARLQAGQPGEMESLDLASVVRDTVADLAPLAHARQRDIDLSVESHPVVHGSAAAIDSAVRNLVENALRHTPPRSVVSVRVGPGGVVAVEDCGPGVSEPDRQRIFEPFVRAGGSGGGAGLGLSIVREVAALHGGAVAVDRGARGGARFTLDFGPAVVAEAMRGWAWRRGPLSS